VVFFGAKCGRDGGIGGGGARVRVPRRRLGRPRPSRLRFSGSSRRPPFAPPSAAFTADGCLRTKSGCRRLVSPGKARFRAGLCFPDASVAASSRSYLGAQVRSAGVRQQQWWRSSSKGRSGVGAAEEQRGFLGAAGANRLPDAARRCATPLERCSGPDTIPLSLFTSYHAFADADALCCWSPSNYSAPPDRRHSARARPCDRPAGKTRARGRGAVARSSAPCGIVDDTLAHAADGEGVWECGCGRPAGDECMHTAACCLDCSSFNFFFLPKLVILPSIN
jgi:hypothetical protein